jgi:hypothetical protein
MKAGQAKFDVGGAAAMSSGNKPPTWMWFGFLFLGLLTGQFGYVMIWRPLRVNLFYVETTCIVLDKKLESVDSLSPEVGTTERPLIKIEYEAGGRSRQTWTYRGSRNQKRSESGVFRKDDGSSELPCPSEKTPWHLLHSIIPSSASTSSRFPGFCVALTA